MDVEFDEDAKWLVMTSGKTEIVCNLSDHAQAIPISTRIHAIQCSEEGGKCESGRLQLPPESVAIATASRLR